MRRRLVSSWLDPLRLSLSFLTILPAAHGLAPDPRAISNSRAFFPLTGLLLGVLLVLVELGAARVFPVYLTAGVLLAVLVAATRGLHLDGLMDVCDALFGGATRERRLEIMKDPHLGAFGVVGGVTILVLKYAAFLALLDPIFRGSWSGGGWASYSTAFLVLEGPPLQPAKQLALLLFPLLSRWAMVVLLGAFPYARSEGLGSPFHQGSARIATLAAALTALAVSVVLGGFGGLGLLLGVTALALALGWVMNRALGGLTGDCYGATNELSEVAVLAAAVALAHRTWLEPLSAVLDRFY